MQLLLKNIAAVLLVGFGQSDHQHSNDDDHGHDKGSNGKKGEQLKAEGK